MSETGPENQPDEAMIDLLIKQVTIKQHEIFAVECVRGV